MIRRPLLVGIAAGCVTILVGLRGLGFGENLTGMIDGRAALEDGWPTSWGWWSLLWRSALLGAAGAVLVGAISVVVRRVQARS